MNVKLAEFLGVLNGFRKFTVMFLLIAIAITFRILDYINGAEFVNLLKGTAIAYMSFNGLEHMTKTVQVWIKKKVVKETVIVKKKIRRKARR